MIGSLEAVQGSRVNKAGGSSYPNGGCWERESDLWGDKVLVVAVVAECGSG